jgi:hypothetical protein
MKSKPTCKCGSGEPSFVLEDARGIYVSRVCKKCEQEVKSKYRADIFTNPNYYADEAIEPEE